MVSVLRSARPAAWLAALVAVTVALVASLGPGLGSPRLGAGSDPGLTVRAKGSLGGEIMEVRVAGAVLATITVDDRWREYRVDTPSAAGAPDVQVAFVNDRVRPRDRNLWVDWVAYGGVTYQAEAETTYGTGVWANGGRCRPGYHRSELLACTGYLGFGDLPGSIDEPTPVVGPGSLITVRAAGNVGSELLELRIDGVPVTAFQLGSSPNLTKSPQYADYVHRHDSPVGADRIEVAFVNDRFANGVDRNVRVSSVTVDDVRYELDDWELVSARGVDEDRCRPAWDRHEVMVCNGHLELRAGAAVAPTTTAAPPTTAAPTTTVAPTTAAPTTAAPTTTAPTTTAAPTTTVPPTTVAPPTTTAEPQPGPEPGAGDRFYVVGTDIVAPDGSIFYPIGANVAIKFTPYGYVFEGNNGGVNDHLDDVRAWNWNTIRATLICDNDSGVPTFDELVEGIHPTIERFTEAGIVVMLECHDATGSDIRLGSAKDLEIRRFWDEMVRRYHDNPYVWFNIYNEPYSSRDTAAWAELHQFYVDRIRAAGAENIVVADLPVWGQGIELLAERDFADDLGRSCNTVFGWHGYGAIANRQGSFADHERYIRAAQDKDMALVVGEYGVASPSNWGNAGPWAWNISGFEALSTLGPRYGIGLLWWHATGDQAYYSLYALKNDRSGFWTAGNSGNLTRYGQQFWDVSQQVEHDLGPFQGDPADSGCPSAQG